MIIDFHTHIFPEKIAYSTIKKLEENSNGKAYTDGTYQGMINALKRANADIAIFARSRIPPPITWRRTWMRFAVTLRSARLTAPSTP